MPTFFYSAENRHGKNVSDKLEAIDLPHARQVLELDGFTSIRFQHDETVAKAMSANGINNLPSVFNPLIQKSQYDNRLSSNWLVFTLQGAAIVSFWTVFYTPGSSPFLFFLNTGLTCFLLYLSVKLVVVNRLVDSIGRCEYGRMRFWGWAFKALMHFWERPTARLAADSAIAVADAREGKVENAIARIRRYEQEALIPKAVYDTAFVTIFEAAGDHEREFRFQDDRLAAGELDTEQILRHAGRIARKKKDIERARALVRTALARELTEVAETLLPLVQGMIESEAGNNRESEFYLIEAEKRLDKFRHHSAFAGAFALANSYLAIVLSNLGQRETARTRFAAARRYLENARETELIERCSNLLK